MKKTQIFVLLLILTVAISALSSRKADIQAASRGKVVADKSSGLFDIKLDEASIFNLIMGSSAAEDIAGRVCILDENDEPTGHLKKQWSWYTAYSIDGIDCTDISNCAYQTEKTYDEIGNLIEEIDPLGNKTIYTYDETQSLPIKIQYPTTNNVEHIIKKTWNPDGSLHTQTDENNNEIVYAYDNLGRALSMIQNEGPDNKLIYSKTTFAYNDWSSADNPAFPRYESQKKCTDQTCQDNTIETRIYYDGFGRIIKQTNSTPDQTKVGIF